MEIGFDFYKKSIFDVIYISPSQGTDMTVIAAVVSWLYLGYNNYILHILSIF